MQKIKPELLAPAGNFISLKAAILAGCDAVYLGGKAFGARAFSNNFSDDELIEAINYAHGLGVKIYVTVNTLIYDNEVDEFLNYIDFLHKNDVDAVIIQDLGMLDLVRQTYPNLEVHASTQMHIHNLEGTKLIENLGVKRVVLARETSYELIKQIKNSTNIELEIFVHGALCISYSGQCLMSSLIGGRSGNRGSCAGSCRQKYDLIVNNKILNKENYLLSTKDLNTLEDIGKLIDIGVSSFKIEGRMKSPSYVYMVVSLYRQAIDSYINNKKVQIDSEKLKKLMTIFNRMYTKGFLFENNGFDITNDYRPNHLGVEIGIITKYINGQAFIKLSDDLNIQDGIRIVSDDIGFNVTNMFYNKNKIKEAKKGMEISIPCGNVTINSKVVKTNDCLLNEEINYLINQTKRKIKIDIDVEVYIGKPFVININNEVRLNGKIVEKANSAPVSFERIKEQISKLGDTNFEVGNIKINGDENIFLSIKDINDYRREAIGLLEESRKIKSNYKKEKYKKEVNDFEKTKQFTIELSTVEQYDLIKNKSFHNIYLEEDIYDLIDDDRKILKLSRVLENHKHYDNKLLIGEIGSLKYENVITDWSFNVTNSYTVAFLHNLGVEKITLSYELNEEQIKDLIDSYTNRYKANPNLELIVFGKEEAMVSKFNLNKKYAVDKSYLKDRFNNLYPVISKNNLMHIYNYKCRDISNINYYNNLGINSFRMILLDENVNKIKEKLEDLF